MKLFDFALQMEREAVTHYQQLALSTSGPGYKRFFSELAADHQDRIEFIEALQAATPKANGSSSQELEEVHSPWETAADAAAEPEVASDGMEKAYRYALKLEEAEIHCYRNMLESNRSKGMNKLLTTIVEEENRHLEHFQNLYDFINAPNQYLAWGEFSNLSEFHQFGRQVD